MTTARASLEQELDDSNWGRQRNRELIRGIASATVSRGIGALAPIALVPLTLPELGAELFGAWMALLGLTGMLIWADLGLGGSLLTQLTPVLARADHQRARTLICTAYAMVGTLALAVIGGILATRGLVNWPGILGVESAGSAGAAELIAVACLALFFLNAPFALIQRILYASGHVTTSNLYVGAGSALSIFLAAAAIRVGASGAVLVALASSGPVIANITATILFFRKRPELLPTLRDLDVATGRTLLRLGTALLGISVISAAATADGLVIAQALDARAVTAYSVPARVIGALGLAITVVNLPLWPMIAAALAAGRVEWVRRTTRRMVAGSVAVVAVGGLAFLVLARPASELLSHGTESASIGLTLGLVVGWILVAATSPLAMVQNATGMVRTQLVGWTIYLIVSLPLKYLVAREVGMEAVPAVGAAAFAVIMVPYMIVGYRQSMRGRAAHPEPPVLST